MAVYEFTCRHCGRDLGETTIEYRGETFCSEYCCDNEQEDRDEAARYVGYDETPLDTPSLSDHPLYEWATVGIENY